MSYASSLRLIVFAEIETPVERIASRMLSNVTSRPCCRNWSTAACMRAAVSHFVRSHRVRSHSGALPLDLGLLICCCALVGPSRSENDQHAQPLSDPFLPSPACSLRLAGPASLLRQEDAPGLHNLPVALPKPAFAESGIVWPDRVRFQRNRHRRTLRGTCSPQRMCRQTPR